MPVVATLHERLRIVRVKVPVLDGTTPVGALSLSSVSVFKDALVSSEAIFPGPPTVLEFIDQRAVYARRVTRAVRTLRSLRTARACHHEQFCQMRGYALRQEAIYAHHRHSA